LVKALSGLVRPTGIAERLTSHRKMMGVWRTLQRTPARPEASSEWGAIYKHFRAEMPDDIGGSLQDKACAVFYFHALVNFSGLRPGVVMTRSQFNRGREVWFELAEICRSEADTVAVDDLAAALTRVGHHFEQLGQMLIMPASGAPYVIERSSRDRGDDEARVQLRWLAIITHKLFGQYLYGTLATVATVALQSTVTEKSARNWCATLQKRDGSQ
jgi:hypothetical protein